ncbi:hypothetical protein M0812_24111 [Anaeramoeba flamelloides]|uniref:Uncharacterized protein n=1 Tax=Anaeramoeba flamelloides TaxID=1746091 RepID=A0AAV7YLC8_9EUKA|nr:hypothetical protein M0812_24111 [Anaeramoeba flamelloides]
MYLLSEASVNLTFGGEGSFDLLVYSFFRSLIFLVVYGCSIRRGLWVASILLILSFVVGLIKSLNIFGKPPTEYLFEYCLLVCNFLFAIAEFVAVHLLNKRHIDEEVSTIFPFSETQQQDRENLISRKTNNEKYNRSKILEHNKKRSKRKIFNSEKKKGMHESYILRGTDPQNLNSFRISFTIIKPDKRPEDSFAQITGIIFIQDKKKESKQSSESSETESSTNEEDEKSTKFDSFVFKQDFDLKEIKFLRRKFQITINKSKITDGAATGIIVPDILPQEIMKKKLFQSFSGSSDDQKDLIELQSLKSSGKTNNDITSRNEYGSGDEEEDKEEEDEDEDREEEKEEGEWKEKGNGIEVGHGDKKKKINIKTKTKVQKNNRDSDQTKEKGLQNHDNYFNFDLSFTIDQKPQLIISNDLLNEKIHSSPLKTSMIIPYPKCEFGGSVSYKLNNKFNDLDLDGWIGCQEHCWGKEYPKKQCYCVLNGGFASDPDASCALLETEMQVSLQKKKIFLFVLRVSGIEIRLNSLYRGTKSYTRSRFQKDKFIWDFKTESQFDEYEGTITAKREHFANLITLDPKNSTRKIMTTAKAKIEIKIKNKKRNITEFLNSQFGIFLEICVNEHDF